ncbi:hypothetical protein EMA8858_00329 [Emticicia aquatica]|uniref:DUF2357 domain-containing protein n=1 Tax=Emticicia aquatica TaxID=1681835 RepID=A0ABM9AKI9_9BACT|nr:DUF2357 domain-containing protein [Emticicia aquatica]CAH0994220.1 hypothetical protein EMA8858_00329 [Emticicia aquatica]
MSVISPNTVALELGSENSLLDNISYTLVTVQKDSDLVFDLYKRCPIILFENKDYIFKVQFNNSRKIEKHESFEVIDSKNDTTYILKFNSLNYVGILNLSFLTIFINPIEIESRKINYQDEYNNLLLKITELDTDLITRASSIFEASSRVGNEITQNDNLLNTKLAFLKSKILSGDFENLYNAFLRKPIKRIKSLTEEKFSWEVDNLDISNYIDGLFKESVSTQNGIIPLKINADYYDDEINTIENQFIKYVLEFVIQLLEEFKRKANHLNLKILNFELEECLQRCNNIKMDPIFKSISRLKYFPTKSNTLQVKYPYRDIFSIYMMLFYEVEIDDERLSASMSTPLKNLPELYEYWCFLTVFEVLNKNFGESDLGINNFIKYNQTNLSYTICPTRSGMTYKIGNDKKVVLYYQKSYSVDNIIYKGRSYSHSLDPDISLELFIDDRLVSIIHFDAKYKLESLRTFKIEDIDKMHTYKDAILGTIGAYVLYPGTKSKSYLQEEMDSVTANVYFPSVGAFVLNIDNFKATTEQSAIFDLINQFINVDISLSSKGIFTNTKKEYNYLKRLID